MNIVNKLTLRQMKLNRKRTLITIIGTIISAAMITAVSLLSLCFIDLAKRETMANTGEWHVLYQNVNLKQLEAIKSAGETKTVIMRRDLGFAPLQGSANHNKPYLFIEEYSREGYTKFPIKLIEGRMPEKPEELVISEAVISNAKVEYSVGDVLNLTIGQRYPTELAEGMEGVGAMQQDYALLWRENQVAEVLTEDLTKIYTIVGIMERPAREYTWSPGYTAISYIDPQSVSADETFDAAVVVKHINNDIFDYATNLAGENGIGGLRFNHGLLRYYGAVKDDALRGMMYTLSVIIMGIIVIGSISLIYNAFAISVSERSRHLGMMSSVGATKKQKRNSVFFEGAVIGAISIPIGIAAGHIGLGITFFFINPILTDTLGVSTGLRVAFFPSAILAAVIISSGTILISTYLPARRASRISAIDAIRQSTDVKVTRKQVRTWRLTRKIFGIEGELGLKNLKRNKKRYKATVFSLIISMLLFLVVSAFTENLKKALYLTQNGINYDIVATVYGDNDAENADLIRRIVTLEDIEELSVVESLEVSAWIPEEKIADYLEEYKSFSLMDGKYPYNVTVNVLSDEVLQRYAEEAGLDYKKLTDPEQPGAVIIDTIKYADDAKGKYVEARAVKYSIGDELELSCQLPDTERIVSLEPLRVAALTGHMPMGIQSHGKYANFHIILSRDYFNRLTEGLDVTERISTQVFLSGKEPMTLQENIENLQSQVGNSKLRSYNLYASRKSEEQVVLLLSIFTYAFIILISAICAANILNTVSTSIALRKREFAMLKSIGITPKGFNIMLNYESMFYGIKALLYGLPASIGAIYLMYITLMRKFEFPFLLPVNSIIIVIAAVFLMVSTAMLYAARKVKKENIIDALKQEII